MIKAFADDTNALARAGCRKGNSTFYVSNEFPSTAINKKETNKQSTGSAESYSFLQFALFNFRESIERYEVLGALDSSVHGTVKKLENLKVQKSTKGSKCDWTWKELTDMVKYSPVPITTSLLKLESEHLTRLAVDSFTAVMKFMGDQHLSNNQTEVECVYAILVICHHHPELRDEIYCQMMKQTTNNKSINPESSEKGWRLLAILTAFFKCSITLKPFLLNYLETAARDYRRVEQAIAEICVHNLHQTFKHGGRRNVPSVDEVVAVSRGEMNKLQVYYLPGGIEQAVITSATTTVQDIIERICHKIGVHREPEISEFSLYCIVEGDLYTMPLDRDEYILDLVAELERNSSTFYLIFCRSVWYFPLRLDSELYIEIIFHQVAPDYLEGFLLVISGLLLSETILIDVCRVAALLHRAAGIEIQPTESEVMYLLPKPVLCLQQLSAVQWVEEVSRYWGDMTALTPMEAKAQCLDILQKWPLFGSCFFGVKMIQENDKMEDYILAVNKTGLNILDIASHETLWRFSFSTVHPPHNVVEEEYATYVDMEFGDTTVKKNIRLQMDHAHEVTRLIQQYQDIQHQSIGEDFKTINFPFVMIKV